MAPPNALHATLQPSALNMAHKKQPSGLSRDGWGLILIAATMPLSTIKSARISGGGMMIHPYLLVMIPMLMAGGWQKWTAIPKALLMPTFLFATTYAMTNIGWPGALAETIKIFAAVATVLIGASMVRRERDIHATILVLVLGIGLVAASGVGTGPSSISGVNPMQGMANKNAFSAYSIPTFLLALHLIQQRGIPTWQQLILTFGIFAILAATFTSGNRSGWLGIGLATAMMLLRRRGMRTLVPLTLAAILCYAVIQHTGADQVIENRLQVTEKGSASDEVRQRLVTTSFAIALEHPIFGLSSWGLRTELARRLGLNMPMVDTHNTFAHLVGGSGFLGFGVFLFFGWRLWQTPSITRVKNRTATTLLHMLLLLWAIRAMFTHELLFSPVFNLSIGLSIGNILLHARRAANQN